MELITLTNKDRNLIKKGQCPYCGGRIEEISTVINNSPARVKKCLKCLIQFETVEEWQFYGRD